MVRKKADGTAAKRKKNKRARPTPASSQQQTAGSAKRGWQATPFWCSAASSLMLLLSFPPFALWPLAFLAPAPLIWLVRAEKLEGPRPYHWIWLGSALGWLALLQGVRLPHPVLYLGWLALSFYVAAYAPLFVLLSRAIVQPLKASILVVAPIVWVGLEFARGYAFTGFSVGLASHPLIFWPELIQLADLGGACAVSFIVVAAASCLARCAPSGPAKWQTWPMIPLTIAVGSAWLYGSWRLKELPPRSLDDGVPVCLLQSNQDVIFVADPQRNVDIFEQCLAQAIEAKRDNPGLRLIIWPESTFSANRREVLIDGKPQPPSHITIEQGRFEQALKWGVSDFDEHKELTARRIHNAARPFGFYDEQKPDEDEQDQQQPGEETDSQASAQEDREEADDGQPTYQLLGTQTERFGDHEPERLNTAIFVGPSGRSISRYHKKHRVMFGEYVPLGDWMPWIYEYTPMRRGLTAGDEPLAFELDGVRFSPNICFEVTVPHLIRRQYAELAAAGETPDVIVNVSNDGWFWGSSILDLHFACNVFRAVELRRDVISSANTGVTAWVDDGGRVRRRAPRRTVSRVLGGAHPARVKHSIYALSGDALGEVCLLLALLAAALGWRKARRA